MIFLFGSSIAFNQTDFLQHGDSDDDRGYCFAMNKIGGYVLAGSVRGGDNESEDYRILSIDSTGNIIWERTYGEDNHDVARHIEQTSDGGYAVYGIKWKKGFTALDGYLLKLDEHGNKQWDKYIGGGAREEGFSMKQTADGGYIVCGFSDANGYSDCYLSRLDQTGNLIWDAILGDIGKDIAFDVFETSTGDIIMTAEFSGFYGYSTFEFRHEHSDVLIYKFSPNGDLIWQNTYGGNQHELAYQTIEGPDGKYYVMASTQSFGNGSFDMYLLKLETDGTIIWEKTYGGVGFDYGMSLSATNDALYLLGSSNNDPSSNKTDIVVVKTDLDGNEEWTTYLGGSESDYGSYIRATDWGCALIGYSKSFSSGDEDFLFSQLDYDGNIIQMTYDDFIRIQVYPNPASNEIQFSILGNQSCFNYPIRITDINGKVVYDESIDAKFIAVDLRNFSSGQYFYKIESDCLDPLVGKFIVR